MRWLKFWFDLFFFQSSSSVTVMTALGLVLAILYASPAPTPVGAVVGCLAIALLGAITVAYQMHHAYQKAKEEEEAFALFEAASINYPDDWKRALKELKLKGSIGEHEVMKPQEFRHIGLVYQEGHTGRFYLLSLGAKIVTRLIKKWNS
jgi:hypothetical protein